MATKRKKSLPSLEVLIQQGKEVLDNKTKKRKPVHYQFSTDPITGRRNNKNTYTPRHPTTKTRDRLDQQNENVEHDDDGITESRDHGHGHDDTFALDNLDETNNRNEIKKLFAEASELLGEWQSAKVSTKSWDKRIEMLNSSWKQSRESLVAMVLKSKYGRCQEELVCNQCASTEPVLWCNECESYLCGLCDIDKHKSSPFHDRTAMNDGQFEEISTNTYWDQSNKKWTSGAGNPLTLAHNIVCPTCDDICIPLEEDIECNDENIHCIAVTTKGRFDMVHGRYVCSACQNVCSTADPLVVIQLGFWPGTIVDVSYIFHQDLFLYWDILQKQVPGVSQSSFVKSLETYSSKKGRVGVINNKTFSSSFCEWKYFQFELDMLRTVNWMECPSCTEKQHSVHVDGNMKLYRYKSAGSSRKECYFGETFVASNEKVDKHIKNIYPETGEKGDQHELDKCGDSVWRAAMNRPKTMRKLDECGLEIAGCRHGLAQHAVNMKRGEIYGYAHYLQVNHYTIPSVEFFWYDVVCQYWPWLKKKDPEILKITNPALSVMHAKAHAWYCQVIWGGRWQKGAAGTTGEEVEQINAHFSKLGTSTKHMLPEAREELLTEHALNWNEKKIRGLPRYLSNRHNKVKRRVIALENDLNSELEMFDITEKSTLEKWKDDILTAARSEQQLRRKKSVMSEEEKTFLEHLLALDAFTPQQRMLFDQAEKLYGNKVKQLHPKRSLECTSGEATLVNKVLGLLELEMEHLHESVMRLSINIGKLADSSKQRTRLRRKMGNEKHALEQAFSNYKKLSPEAISGTVQDVTNGMFPWKDADKCADQVPLATKRSLVDKYMELGRFQEEIQLVEIEMIRFLKFYTRKKLPDVQRRREALLNDLASHEHAITKTTDANSGRYTTTERTKSILRGKLALLKEGISFVLEQVAVGVGYFGTILDCPMDEYKHFLEMYADDGENEIVEDESISTNNLLSDESDIDEDDDDDEERLETF